MPRIEIELTSSRADGSWTWRAAGARQPKGTLNGNLLSGGAKVGDVLRADVEVDVDGMTVTALLPPKAKRADEGRLEMIAPPVKEAPTGLNWADFDGTDRPRRGGAGGRDRLAAGGPRRDRPAGQGRPGGGRPAGDGRSGTRPPGPGRPGAGRPDEGREGGRAEAGRPSGGRPSAARPPGGRAPSGGSRGERSGPPRDRPPRSSAPPPAPKPRPKRLNAGRAHRDEVLASLPPEEQPIAEHLLRGGIPAVRHAVEEQNTAARAAGSPEVKAEALLEIAERLAPRLRAAEWRDRAEAAVIQAEEVALRDLRTLVASADAVGRDEASRELAGRLRQVLDERSAKEQDAWVGEITEAMEAGRVVRALRTSGRPPDPSVRFPAALAERLGAAAGEAMTADVAADRWAAVLEAVSASPVRRLVKPQGLPAEAPPELVKAARQAAERVPGLVPLVGAPPPAPDKRRAGGPPRARHAAPRGPGERPPPPPRRAPIPPPPRPPTPPAAPADVADAAVGGTAPAEPEPEQRPEPPDPPVQAREPEQASDDHGDDVVLVEELS